MSIQQSTTSSSSQPASSTETSLVDGMNDTRRRLLCYFLNAGLPLDQAAEKVSQIVGDVYHQEMQIDLDVAKRNALSRAILDVKENWQTPDAAAKGSVPEECRQQMTKADNSHRLYFKLFQWRQNNSAS